MSSHTPLPPDAADHLLGRAWPDIPLPATDGAAWSLAGLDTPAVVFAYPRTAEPGAPPLTSDWDHIPGAAGCTAEACGFRDHHSDFVGLRTRVFGLSMQDTEYQREMSKRLGLTYPVLSDAAMELTRALQLPTFEAAGHTMLRRLTVFVERGQITHIWYPIPEPTTHAHDVSAWVRTRTAPGT